MEKADVGAHSCSYNPGGSQELAVLPQGPTLPTHWDLHPPQKHAQCPAGMSP